MIYFVMLLKILTFSSWWLTQRSKICSGDIFSSSSGLPCSPNKLMSPGTFFKVIPLKRNFWKETYWCKWFVIFFLQLVERIFGVKFWRQISNFIPVVIFRATFFLKFNDISLLPKAFMDYFDDMIWILTHTGQLWSKLLAIVSEIMWKFVRIFYCRHAAVSKWLL